MTLQIVFVMTGACVIPGGIAAHNQQILRVLDRFVREREVHLTVLSFLEKTSDRPGWLADQAGFRGFQGSKLGLAFALIARSLARPLFIFDHVTLALPLLPLIASRFVKAVIFAHGSESWRRIRRTSKWLFASARLVIANSQFTLKEMRKRIARLEAVACPLGLAPQFTLNSTVPSPPLNALSLANAEGETKTLGARVCLLVGRLHPDECEKGHRELLDVWPEILADFRDAQLVFAGPGDDRENLARIARETGVAKSVFLTGALPHEQLRELYETCYAFTMPSRQEGFGLVYLEAMNAAKPCLGCRDGGAEEIIVHEETGLLIRNPVDGAELLSALQRLLSDPEIARAMGRRGLERLRSKFTAAEVQRCLDEQLSRVI
ncbi:MAG: glycosyltransferase family 4 protein [Chthoniobacterales bacterium]